MPSSESGVGVVRGGPLPRLGDALPGVIQRFSAQGVLGVVLIHTGPLQTIEADHGSEAHAQVIERIAAVAEGALGSGPADDELFTMGELGRHEIVLFLFRTLREGGFYRSDLPATAHAIQRALLDHGRAAAAPYLRSAPELGVGFAASVRNPHLGAETQLRDLLGEARTDADVEAHLLARRRRRRLMGTILAGEITSVYEPIVEVETRTVFGYEALARGPVGSPYHSPLHLFEDAEAESLVFELDCLCRQSGLDGAIGLPGGTQLFLNVRPTTIHDPAFRPDALVRTLERTHLSPSDVVLEISEQESIASFARFREIRDEYRALGFRFALDDTGAGYASLQALIEIEPDFIKVDRALITGLDVDPARQGLLRALQTVSSVIGSRIIAEGLDTLEELEMLGELGIPFGQGWLFGKPTPLRA